MKVILVSTYSYPLALGLRYISSCLKAIGHDVQMIFMSSKRATAGIDYTPATMESFVERCRGADLVGMSLMTNSFNRASVLTDALRKASNRVPVIWGGTHPTVAPDESLARTDMVCVGEGEEPMLRLVERMEAGRDPTDVGSIWFRADGPFKNRDTVRNPVQPLNENLDAYPFPDYELHTHWVIEKGELVRARPDNLRGTIRHFRVESARGCPYSCAFCNNAALMAVHKGKGPWVRKRSNENVIQEMEKALASFPEIEDINVVDDLFFIRNEEEMEDFVERYIARVNLPIQLDAFPNTVTERKVAALSRMPIDLISMGIQSGSPDTLQNIYKRRTPIKKIIECMTLFRRYGLKTEYHYIITNPYEPGENVIETMRFVANHHHGPTKLRVFPLMFYPGTPLFERACADGVIDRRDPHAYDFAQTSRHLFSRHDYLSTWLHVTLSLRNARLPSWWCHRLIDLVTSRPVRKCIDRPAFAPVSIATYYVFRKAYKLLVYQPFVRPYRSLRARFTRDRRASGAVRAQRHLLAGDLGTSAAPGAGRSTPLWTVPRADPASRRPGSAPDRLEPSAGLPPASPSR